MNDTKGHWDRTAPETETPRWSAMILSVQGGMFADKSDGVTYEEDYKQKADDLGRTLERENERLKKELEEAVSRGKLEALKYTQEERERFGKWCAQNNDWREIKADRDRFRTLAADNWKLAEEAIERLSEYHPLDSHNAANYCKYCSIIYHFQTQKAKQPK